MKKVNETFLKLLFSLLLLWSVQNSYSKSSFSDTLKIKNIVKTITQKKVEKHLRSFVACCRPNRIVGSPGHKKSQEFLYKYLKETLSVPESEIEVQEFKADIQKAIDVYEGDFKREIVKSFAPETPIYKKWKIFTDDMVFHLRKREKTPGKNIIWKKKAKKENAKTLVIGAHYDTIAHNKKLQIQENILMPGADDNGSGVAVAIALIEILKDLETDINIEVVFFDWEELGFLGSHYYAKERKKVFNQDNYLGYINLEMLGNDTQTKDKAKVYGNMKVYLRTLKDDPEQRDLKLLEKLKKFTAKNSHGVKFIVVQNSFNSSDHINFWEQGLQAITFTQDWENDFNKDRYHTSDDLPETLNMKTLYNSFRYIATGVVGVALGL